MLLSIKFQVKLHFTENALRLIAKKAMAKNTGARGLRAILENILTEAMFEVCLGPSIYPSPYNLYATMPSGAFNQLLPDKKFGDCMVCFTIVSTTLPMLPFSIL